MQPEAGLPQEIWKIMPKGIVCDRAALGRWREPSLTPRVSDTTCYPALRWIVRLTKSTLAVREGNWW